MYAHVHHQIVLLKAGFRAKGALELRRFAAFEFQVLYEPVFSSVSSLLIAIGAIIIPVGVDEAVAI